MKKDKLNLLLNIAIYILIAICSINLVYYIFVGSKALLNSDSWFVVDYAKEAIKYKTLFPKSWANTNDFWVYSLIPMIIPFLKMGVSVFLSRQIPVLIQTILLVLIIFDLNRRITKNFMSNLLIILLIVSGLSGQVMFELFGDATYGTIIFFMILELYLFVLMIQSKKVKYYIFLGLFTIILTAITACSLRFPIYITAPLLCTVVALYIDDKFEKRHLFIIAGLGVATIGGYLMHNYMMNHLTLITGSYGVPTIGDSSSLMNAFNDFKFNYLHVAGSLNLNTYSLSFKVFNDFITNDSPFVVIIFIRFVFALLLIVMPIMIMVKYKKLELEEKLISIFAISFNIIMIFFILICKLSLWYRYVTPMIFMLLMLIPIFYRLYIMNNKKVKLVFIMFIIASCISSLILVVNSYYDIDNKKFRDNPHQGLADYLVEHDLYYGYKLSGDEHGLYYMLSDGKVRLVCISQDGKHPVHWLNSSDWFTEKYTDGKIFFVRKKDEGSLDIEKQAIETLEYENYDIFVFKNVHVVIDNFE